VAGAGVLAQSRQEVFLRWNRIRKVEYKPRSRTILLRGSLTESMALICKEDNYAQNEKLVMDQTQRLKKEGSKA
jgi:hypothetical protein